MHDLIRRIEEKIAKRSSLSKEVKSFILEAVTMELEKGTRWNFSQEYERLIANFAEKYKFSEGKNEDRKN
jgi:hypothetical protein